MKSKFRSLSAIYFLTLIFMSCSSDPSDQSVSEGEKGNRESSVDTAFPEIQGHRGCRGLYPENSIEGFLAAIDLGVDVLELDVVVSKDSMVLVSHEPWLNPEICNGVDGNPLGNLPYCMIKYNLFAMDYSEIERFPCGMSEYDGFPLQKKIKTHKPLLSDVLLRVEQHCKANDKPMPKFNIELKYVDSSNGIFHPNAESFAELVLDVTKEFDHLCTYQSFSTSQLEALHALHPGELVYLIENDELLNENLAKISFIPAVYSPNHEVLNPNYIFEVQSASMKCIPWTVNNQQRMMELIEWGVDGIITDYPDSLLQLKANSL